MAVVEGAVEGIRGVEVGVRASRDDFAVIENDDRRGVADRGKTVRDDQDGFADDELLERELDGGLAVAVEGAGGLVEDENGGVAEEGAGEGEALFLSARETRAAFADEGFVASGKTEDKLVRVGGAGGGLDLGAGSFGARDEEIVVDRVVEKDGVLGDDGDVAAEVGEAEGAEIVAVEGDATGHGVEEARDEIGEGGFAGAAWADEGADGAGGDEDGDFLEDGFVRGVGEGEVFEGECAVGAGEREGRVWSPLVRARHWGFSHGVGRSGELMVCSSNTTMSAAAPVCSRPRPVMPKKSAGSEVMR